MPRQIETHKVNGCNDKLDIWVMDGPGPGGACHQYQVTIPNQLASQINFQNGAIAEVGTNGLTHEALLAIVEDRLEAFQRGPYACDDNHKALTAVRDAIWYLKQRTIARVRRGVEGTMAV